MAQQQNNKEGTALIQKRNSNSRGSLIAASFNFINSIIGSGIIGLPYALNQAGLPLGLILLILVGFITDYSIVLLIKGGNLSGSTSYQSLVQSTFGFPGFLILSALQFLYPFIAMISYNITTGDTLTKVFQRIPGAFICHHNSFLIYNSLDQPTLSSWSRVTHISVGSSLIISATFAVAGYTTFTGYTQGDIFENYCRNDNLATFGRFCFGFSIITTFPLECFVTREVISNVICSRLLSKAEHVAITLLIVAVCTALSLAYDCLGMVLELNGALSATPLIFIIPSACYLKISPGSWFQSDKMIPALLIIIGLVVMIIGLIMTGVFPQDCSHGVEMFYCTDVNISGTVPPK
ncbi:putative sodium-coupled neutral amino acid transporter 11 isoform X3 [Cyprinodon tularosa]|uniref:putative sodium-coupled neutral amino acid transporter 11 isoform X3 n=1 Tax=Cyprinodon tularosa TaxID=77115 RepID=UPI0018E20CC4|nr:putative sodium-coupled neutral amino acid transporter 11 isoform X3 [Cyprinodon tularosa]